MKVEELEKLAGTVGLLIKIQVRETLGLSFCSAITILKKHNPKFSLTWILINKPMVLANFSNSATFIILEN